jgi:amino acid permease
MVTLSVFEVFYGVFRYFEVFYSVFQVFYMFNGFFFGNFLSFFLNIYIYIKFLILKKKLFFKKSTKTDISAQTTPHPPIFFPLLTQTTPREPKNAKKTAKIGLPTAENAQST